MITKISILKYGSTIEFKISLPIMKFTFAVIILLLISVKTIMNSQATMNHDLIDMNFYWAEYIKTHQLQKRLLDLSFQVHDLEKINIELRKRRLRNKIKAMKPN